MGSEPVKSRCKHRGHARRVADALAGHPRLGLADEIVAARVHQKLAAAALGRLGIKGHAGRAEGGLGLGQARDGLDRSPRRRQQSGTGSRAPSALTRQCPLARAAGRRSRRNGAGGPARSRRSAAARAHCAEVAHRDPDELDAQEQRTREVGPPRHRAAPRLPASTKIELDLRHGPEHVVVLDVVALLGPLRQALSRPSLRPRRHRRPAGRPT